METGGGLLTPAQRRWAVLRVTPGTAQVMAATVSAVFVLQVGVTTASLSLVTGTTLLTLLSRFLFREQ